MPRGIIETNLAPPAEGATAYAPHTVGPGNVDIRFTKNVLQRDNWLVPRPGLFVVGPHDLPSFVNGAALWNSNDTTIEVVATSNRLFYFNGTVWIDIQGSASLSSAMDRFVKTQFAQFPSAGFDWLIGVSGHQAQPYKWRGPGYTAVNIPAAPPARDVCIAGNRVIMFNIYEDDADGMGFQPRLRRLRWSDFNDPDTWQGISVAELNQTPDIIVAGKQLSRISFVIYKEESQWLGESQAGIYPFKFEQQDSAPGPMSPRAVMNYRGTHYYIGRDWSAYTFDGSRVTEIGQPIQKFLMENADLELGDRIFTTYHRYDRMIMFFFPRGASSLCDAALSYNVVTGKWFYHEYGAPFPPIAGRGFTAGIPSRDVSAASWNVLGNLGYTWDTISPLYTSWDAVRGGGVQYELVFGGTLGTLVDMGAFAVDPLTFADVGEAYTCRWRSSHLSPNGPSKRARAQSFETHFVAPAAAQNVTVKVGGTDSLSVDPTFAAALTKVHNVFLEPVKVGTYDEALAGFGSGTAEQRFIVVDHETAQPVGGTGSWKWGGGILRTYEQETGEVNE